MSAALFCHTCGFALPAQAGSCPACGAAIVSTTEAAPQAGQTLSSSAAPVPPLLTAACVLPAGSVLAGRYQILQQLGQGGFAEKPLHISFHPSIFCK